MAVGYMGLVVHSSVTLMYGTNFDLADGSSVFHFGFGPRQWNVRLTVVLDPVHIRLSLAA